MPENLIQPAEPISPEIILGFRHFRTPCFGVYYDMFVATELAASLSKCPGQFGNTMFQRTEMVCLQWHAAPSPPPRWTQTMARDVRSSIDCILQCKPWAFVAFRGKDREGRIPRDDSEFLLEIYVDHKKVCLTDETTLGGVGKDKLRPPDHLAKSGGVKYIKSVVRIQAFFTSCVNLNQLNQPASNDLGCHHIAHIALGSDHQDGDSRSCRLEKGMSSWHAPFTHDKHLGFFFTFWIFIPIFYMVVFLRATPELPQWSTSLSCPKLGKLDRPTHSQNRKSELRILDGKYQSTSKI